MFLPEHWQVNYDRNVPLELRRIMVTKRYFCKRGRYLQDYDWLGLFQLIQDFKMVLAVKYNFSTKLLACEYVSRNYR